MTEPLDRPTALAAVRGADAPPDADGVPTVLALVDAHVDLPTPQRRGVGPAVARRVEELAGLLAPDADDGDQRTHHLLVAAASLAVPDDALDDGPSVSRGAGAAVADRGRPPGARAQVEAVRRGAYLRVVNFHATPASGRERLREQLRGLAARATGVGLADLDAFFATGRWPVDGEVFAPVFYEGYADSAQVAAEVCDELGLVGWFAVCTGFVDCPVDQQEVYARAHWIGLAPEELDGRRLAMTWDEVADLSSRHVVFPHTASHAGLADVRTDDDLDREVAAPKRRMDEVTGGSAALHAWLLGTPHGGSPRHDDAVVAAGYRYVVSNTAVQRVGGAAAT